MVCNLMWRFPLQLWGTPLLWLRSGESRCESESGSAGESNVEMPCCDEGSSCVSRSCSGFDCGYESVSARSWDCEGRPPSPQCRPSLPEHTHSGTLISTCKLQHEKEIPAATNGIDFCLHIYGSFGHNILIKISKSHKTLITPKDHCCHHHTTNDTQAELWCKATLSHHSKLTLAFTYCPVVFTPHSCFLHLRKC